MRYIENTEIRLIHTSLEPLKVPVEQGKKEPAIPEGVREVNGVTVLHEDILPDLKPPFKRRIIWE